MNNDICKYVGKQGEKECFFCGQKGRVEYLLNNGEYLCDLCLVSICFIADRIARCKKMTQNERLKEKQRLIELFETSPSIVGSATWREYYEQTADHFLGNGVIVPPCKVGDTVYSIGWLDATVKEEKILYLTYDSRLNNLVFETAMCLFDANQIGKFVFLNREAAEQALKERETK